MAEGLRTNDVLRLVGAFPEQRIAALREEAERAHAAGAFAAARIGRTRAAQQALRGDELCWLDALTDAPACRALQDELDALRIALDRALLLGLRSVEAQFARYAPGARYARHLDRFAAPAHPQGGADGTGARMLSLVLYLNDGWRDADGGALRLYDAAGRGHDVPPVGGDLVVFLSDRVEHEVLPAARTRWSVAAWFTGAPASPSASHRPHSMP